MPLSDIDIRRAINSGWIGVEPFDPSMVQPASVDLTLGDEFVWYSRASENAQIDPRKDQSKYLERGAVPAGASFWLGPGAFALGTTVETVSLDACYRAKLEGKSSLGRIGLIVHVTAGFIDPGFTGNITLEFLNATRRPILLWPGMKIAQISFDLLETPAERPYGHPDLKSKYQNQTGTTASALHQNFQERLHGEEG